MDLKTALLMSGKLPPELVEEFAELCNDAEEACYTVYLAKWAAIQGKRALAYGLGSDSGVFLAGMELASPEEASRREIANDIGKLRRRFEKEFMQQDATVDGIDARHQAYVQNARQRHWIFAEFISKVMEAMPRLAAERGGKVKDYKAVQRGQALAAERLRRVHEIALRRELNDIEAEYAEVARAEGAKTAKQKRRRRRRVPAETRPLTPKQIEALTIVGECCGNKKKAAENLGIDRKSLTDRLEGAWKKLGAAEQRHLEKNWQRPGEFRGILEDKDGQPMADRDYRDGVGIRRRRKPRHRSNDGDDE